MKRLLCIFTACLLLVGMLCALPVSAAAGLSVSASASTITVGKSVTVTLKYSGDGKPIGGLMGRVSYDAKVFTYESYSGSDVEVNGGAGIIKYAFDASGAEAPKSLTISLTFKAKNPGSCDFAVSTEEFFNDEDYSSLGSPSGKVTVECNNPTLSNNANLKSLKPSNGSLSPKFSPDVTEYSIEVAYSVESLSLVATTDHDDAKTSISGRNALEVGKNTRVITVTAPNGSTKKYTVVITRLSKPTTTTTYRPSTTTTTQSTTTTTTVPIPDDALDVEIDGKDMVIADTQLTDELPEGFSWGTVTINHVEVPAAISPQGLTLLYLTCESDDESNSFYIYNAEEDTFTPYRSVKTAGSVWVLYDLPTEIELDADVTPDTLAYEGGSVSAYVYESEELEDFYVVWAAPLDGETGWYTYDASQGTFQRYHAVTKKTTATTTTTKATVADKKENSIKSMFSLDSIKSFFSDYRKVLIGALVVLSGVILGIIIRLIIASISGGKKRRRRGKH